MLTYTLDISNGLGTFPKVPNIPAVPRAVYGHYDCPRAQIQIDSKPYGPDLGAVRAALPYRLRKAWDRNAGAVWFDAHDCEKPASATLYAARGRRPLATLYFFPVRAES